MIPSGEVITDWEASVAVIATATNIPVPLTVPYVTPCQYEFAAALSEIQVYPVGKAGGGDGGGDGGKGGGELGGGLGGGLGAGGLGGGEGGNGTELGAEIITRSAMVPVAVLETETNLPPPEVMLCQLLFAAAVLAVHVIPSGEVITLLSIVPAAAEDTAVKRLLPYATLNQPLAAPSTKV